MHIRFSSSALAKAFESKDAAIKLLGEARGKKYVMAIQLIKQAKTEEDLYKIPQLKFHGLKGNRDGEYAVTLTGNWRLILTRVDDETLRVEKVEDYHGR